MPPDRDRDRGTFLARKALGTAAEQALTGILTAAGAIVTQNQINRDATHYRPGAALAYLSNRTLHLPDLTVNCPPRSGRYHVEVKAKCPLARGGYGWDRHAFARALDYSLTVGEPVYYAVRNLDAAPLPLPGDLDDPAHWRVASVIRLLGSDHKVEGQFRYWALEDFSPLSELIGGTYGSIPIHYMRSPDGPPVIL